MRGRERSATTFGSFAADFLGGYLANLRALRGDGLDAALHDPCAVLAVTDPHLLEVAKLAGRGRDHRNHTRGMTVVDQRWWARGGNVEWAHTIDAPAAKQVVLGRDRGGPLT